MGPHRVIHFCMKSSRANPSKQHKENAMRRDFAYSTGSMAGYQQTLFRKSPAKQHTIPNVILPINRGNVKHICAKGGNFFRKICRLQR